MSTQRGKEEPFTAKNHGFQVTGALDVIINVTGEPDNATRVDPQCLSPEFLFNNGSSCVKEGHAVTLKLLQDEPFSTK